MKEIIVHCPTEELWNKVQEKMFSEGKSWAGGQTKLPYQEVWCICYGVNGFGNNMWKSPRERFEREYPDIPIIPAQEYLNQHKFKVGDRVRVISQESSVSSQCIGGVGIITEIGHNPENEVKFSEEIGGRKIWYIGDDCLELVSQPFEDKSAKSLTHSQFLDYIKKHGPTKARITEDYFRGWKKGDEIEFWCEGSGIASEAKTDTLTCYWNYWGYKGLFELVEERGETAIKDIPRITIDRIEPYTDVYREMYNQAVRNLELSVQPRPILLPDDFWGKPDITAIEKLIKPNQSIIKKTMSIINNAVKSKENKAMENFGLGTTDQLNNGGRDEFVDYLFQNLPEQKKGFLEKIVEAGKEEK